MSGCQIIHEFRSSEDGKYTFRDWVECLENGQKRVLRTDQFPCEKIKKERENNKTNELQIFQNPEFGKVRAIEKDGEPWLVGKDVAEALGYKNTKDALKMHVDDEDKQILQRSEIATIENHLPKSAFPIDFVNGEVPNRGLTIINESGLYSLILSSKLPGAKKFKRWVTSEVLPSIRKAGGYIAGQESMTPEELMAQAILVANKTIEQQKARLSSLTVEKQIMQPKADYFDELVERNTLTNFRETAQELGIPQKRFVNSLIEKKFVYRDPKGKLMPYANRNDGLFEIKECYNEKTKWCGTQTLITPKGRETFRLLCL